MRKQYDQPKFPSKPPQNVNWDRNSDKNQQPDLKRAETWAKSAVPDMNGEPLFTFEAEIFMVPDNKMKHSFRHPDWLQMSTQPICFHIVKGDGEGKYRLMGVDGCKVLLNCYVPSASWKLKKGGDKFVNWQDPQSQIVYGFGFETKEATQEFITKFKEYQSLALDEPVATVCDVKSETNVVVEKPFTDLSEMIPASQETISEQDVLRKEVEQLKATLAESQMASERQNVELKATINEMMAMMKSGRFPAMRTLDKRAAVSDVVAPLPIVENNTVLPKKQPPIPDFAASRRRYLSIGNGVENLGVDNEASTTTASGIPKDITDKLDQISRHENGNGPRVSDRNAQLQIQLLIEEKLKQALDLQRFLIHSL